MVHKRKIKLFVSSSLIFGLWTIVCLFVFILSFVDHSLSRRRQTMVHKRKIKDEETNNGPQTKD
jgi:hypothetical protein